MKGESGSCVRNRCGEHIRAYERKAKDSNLWDHCRDVHGGVRVEFGCKVVGHFPGDVLGRKLDKEIRIDREPGHLMNG